VKHSTKNQAYMRARYRYWASIGICTHCGCRPARANRKTCASCAAKSVLHTTKRLRKLRQVNRSLGVCIVCNARESMPRLRWCAVCAEVHTERQVKVRARRREAGKCPRCGKVRDREDRAQCAPCREISRARAAARRHKAQAKRVEARA
jgi:hypothetical protein